MAYPHLFQNTNILITSDSQSNLHSLSTGHITFYCPLSHSTDHTWSLILQSLNICNFLIFQYVPAHIGLLYNEIADFTAKQALQYFPSTIQNSIPISFPAFKTFLKQKITTNYLTILLFTQTHCQMILHLTPSKLHLWSSTPWSLQCLYSWYCLVQTKTIGPYPCFLNWISQPFCRFCSHLSETPYHLLTTCLDTFSYRYQNDLSIQDLVSETPSSIFKIAKFDNWLRDHLEYDVSPPRFIPSTITPPSETI